ncbi:FAD-dependent oxidoreductase domain-containing protein [Daphnia magna]|uniref:FAD-dependent oxidoreductase domain-containing protein 1 n=2 Tax=Daphnia magna TaxID=35525 RepID=A0A164ZDR6_9CRUS|nr:hypothetical protein OUZ56_030365 [Daphnia magna]KZS16239.1 FAD-dependent oxidoreductase domain-containing protein [Daphnia magna]
MFNRAVTAAQLKPWLKFNYILKNVTFTVRSFCNSCPRYSNKDDEPVKPSILVPEDFQAELDGETYCPPLAQPIKPHVHPIKKSFDLLGITGRNDPKTHNNLYFPRHCDILIIGGGIMGCSIAYWLKQRGHDNGLRVIVVEQDPSYTRASTVLSVGGLRQQFSLPENIEMSLYGAEFLRKSKKLLSGEGLEGPDVQFHPFGYLFLATEKGADQLIANHKLQTSLGAKIQLLSANKLKQKFPWINTDGVELASLGLENEGWFDPWSLLNGFRNKALEMGVEFVKAETVGFETQETIVPEQPGIGDSGCYHKLKRVHVRLHDGDIRTIDFSKCVMAAGAQSGKVSKLAGIGLGTGLLRNALPVEPRKRYVYCFHAPEGPGLDCPLTVDTTGSYFRREGLGGHYVAGKSPTANEEPGVANLDVDYTFFDQQVWPDVALRVPGFENIKLKSAWSGYYDYNTFDQNGVIGIHPYHTNFLFATGFSGHGLQQAPAVGRAIMELVLEGKFLTIDLSRFAFDRVIANQPVFEQNIV